MPLSSLTKLLPSQLSHVQMEQQLILLHFGKHVQSLLLLLRSAAIVDDDDDDDDDDDADDDEVDDDDDASLS